MSKVAGLILAGGEARRMQGQDKGLVLFQDKPLIAHVIVAQEKGAEALRQTALFGIWSLIPYFIYLLLVYLLAERLSL